MWWCVNHKLKTLTPELTGVDGRLKNVTGFKRIWGTTSAPFLHIQLPNLSQLLLCCDHSFFHRKFGNIKNREWRAEINGIQTEGARVGIVLFICPFNEKLHLFSHSCWRLTDCHKTQNVRPNCHKIHWIASRGSASVMLICKEHCSNLHTPKISV